MSDEQLILLLDLLDKIGYNTESAGSGTVFQRLAQLADSKLTDARMTKIDSISVVSVQRGQTSLDLNTAYVDVTITAVTLAKAFIVITTDGSQNVLGYLTSTTNLRISHQTGVTNKNINWEVVQIA